MDDLLLDLFGGGASGRLLLLDAFVGEKEIENIRIE